METSELRWVRLGEFIEPYSQKCGNPEAEVSGVNIYKEFMHSHANLTNTDISSYSSVPSKCFATNLMHIGRDERIPIAFNNSDKELVVTSAYSVFRVKKGSEVSEEYIFLFFNSKEIDRLAWFYTDGSVRGNLKEKRLLDIKIPVPYKDGKPDRERQRVVVDSWQGLRRMKEQNEKMVEPLQQLCRSFMESLKKNYAPVAIGQFITLVDERNNDGKYSTVMGMNAQKVFMPTVANLENVDITKYKVVRKGQLAFSGMQTGRDRCIRIAINTYDEPILVSPAYITFRIRENSGLLPDFAYICFHRDEMDRYGWFISDSSVRSNLDLTRFLDIQIPLPDIETQRAIVNIYHCAEEAKRIAQEADKLSREICPALMQHIIHETH